MREIRGTLSAAGVSPPDPGHDTLAGLLALHLSGTFVATIQVEASKDNGATWAPVSLDPYGTTATFTAPIRRWFFEPEDGVRYRVNCTAYTSGTVNYWLSQSP